MFVAAVWAVTTGGSFDRTQAPAVPGGAETGPKVTNPTPKSAVGPVPETDYLLDLNTGEMTPLPESIVGTADVTTDYAVSPDGSRLAYERRGGNDGIFVANLDGTGIEQVANDLGLAHSPAWSPDGSKIAFIGNQGAEAPERIFVWYFDAPTGRSTPVAEAVDLRLAARDDAQSPTYSPDGSSILYSVRRGGDRGEVRIVPVAGGIFAGGESERLVSGASDLGDPQLSPDGSLLSYSCGVGWRHDLCLANADGTDARVLVAGSEGPGSWSPDGTRIAYWTFPSGVYVVDVATGEETQVARGALPTWLDGHTLIVEADSCSNPPHSDALSDDGAAFC